MELAFEKWHGCQNDFILIHLSKFHGQTVKDSLQRQATALCSRGGSGIGADGIILVEPSEQETTARLITIFNQDGSVAAHCGNGLRCAAGTIFERHTAEKKLADDPLEGIELIIEDQRVFCQFMHNARPSMQPLACLTMGTPKLNNENPWHNDVMELVNRFQDIDEIHTCDLGNKHLVVFCAPSDIQSKMHEIGHALQNSKLGRELNLHTVGSEAKTPALDPALNATLTSTVSETYLAASWERGCGPTKACGSGAAAITAVVLGQELTPRDSWLEVQMPGGSLFTKQTEANAPVLLVGEATKVFTGVLDI